MASDDERDELLELMAKAAYDETHDSTYPSWDKAPLPIQAAYMTDAIAMLEAIEKAGYRLEPRR